DIFVHDRVLGLTERVSVDSNGVQGNARSSAPAISGDGRYVAFESHASNLVARDTNDERDIFVHDRVLGLTERVSVSSNGVQSINTSGNPVLSGDGRYVAFDSWSPNLVPGDTNYGNDVFVHDRVLGSTERVSVSSDGAQGDDQSASPSISDDGRYVAFDSWASTLVEGDIFLGDDGIDVFVHDRVLGLTERVSVASDGAPGDRSSLYPSISDDGRYVAFYSSASNLVADDTNDVGDVFVHDRVLGLTERVSVASDRIEGIYDASRFSSISGNGRYVTFAVRSDLAAGDTNNREDVYVAARSMFIDTADSVFEADIEWLAAEGITTGCNPPFNTIFCPADPVTRGQMAAFLVRALDLTDDGGGDLFVDDDTSVFEGDIDRLGTAGITKGCNPPDNDLFCPNDPVTRGQMAAFLVRALGYTDDGGGDLFVDDDGNTFEASIDKLATAGVTRGCNPPVNDEFCPHSYVTRGQMAAFLHRALG
nr:S-layer homology domain-containing protein [Acidimicrobiia bacterium]